MIITLTGADFSANNINLPFDEDTWYTEFAVGSAKDGTNIAKADFAGFTYQEANDKYIEKPINAVRLRVAQAGTMTIGIASEDRKTITDKQIITLANPSTSEVQIYQLSDVITLAKGQALCFGATGDTGLFYYKEAGTATANNGERMWHHVGTSGATKATSTASLSVDAGYVVS